MAMLATAAVEHMSPGCHMT